MIFNAIKNRLTQIIPAILAWILYECTNADGLYWGDAGEFVTVSKGLGIGHAYGHPLFWLLGRIGILLYPENPAAGVNHVVAFAAACTVFILAWIVHNHLPEMWSLHDRLIITVVSTGLYATGITVWVQATYAEVYQVHALMTALFLLCLDRYFFRHGSVVWLSGAAYSFGLAFTLGQYMAILILLIPLFVLFGTRRLRMNWIFAGIFLFSLLLGLSIWIYLPVRSSMDPPIHLYLLDSLSSMKDYLIRTSYAAWKPAGWIAVPFGLKQALSIWLNNLSIMGILLIILWIIVLYRNRYVTALPWFLGALFYTAVCGLLIPLTMTAVQMNEMDVYLIPAMMLSIPVIALGLQTLLQFLRTSLRPLILLPLLVLAIFNWSDTDISGTNETDRFVRYLKNSLPDSVRVLPTTDNVIHPIWYQEIVEGNPKSIEIEPNYLSEIADTNWMEMVGMTPLFMELDGVVFNRMRILKNYSLAGPFIGFNVDERVTSQMDSVFISNFSYDTQRIQNLNHLDRISMAKFWYNRSRYFFTTWQLLPDSSADKTAYWEKAIDAYQQTASLDDFSSIGADTRARLALMHVNTNRIVEGVEWAQAAIRISPLATEAYRALFVAAYRRMDYRSAIEQLKRLIRLDSDNGNVWMDVALCHEKLGDLDAARNAYRKGIAMGAQPDKYLTSRLKVKQSP